MLLLGAFLLIKLNLNVHAEKLFLYYSIYFFEQYDLSNSRKEERYMPIRLGDMPIKFIGNYFVMFYTKHLALEFIGIYIQKHQALRFIGKLH